MVWERDAPAYQSRRVYRLRFRVENAEGVPADVQIKRAGRVETGIFYVNVER